VGKILAGTDGRYDGVSSFFSEVFGDVSRFNTLTTEGSLEDSFLARYGHEGRLVGALTVGQSEELETLVKELIADRAAVEALERELVG
jgi:hypothetical protein